MRLFVTFLALLLLASMTGPARAASSDLFETPEASVRLVTAVEAVGSLAAIPAGIEFELAPGWKTYWRTPGDAGYPVTVAWLGSSNLEAGDLRWPAPHRFTLFGLDTFGYSDRVLFPVTLIPERTGEAMHVAAQIRYLLCEEICIPYEADLALELPVGPATPAPEAQLIDRFESQVPGRGAEHGIDVERVAIEGGAVPAITVTAKSDLPFVGPDLLVEGSYDWRFPAPTLVRADANHEVTLTIAAKPLAADAPPLESLPLTLTLVDGTRGVEFTVEPYSATTVPTGSRGIGIVVMLAAALLGGLILNLMPCVLPVLSLKLLSVIGHGGGDRATVRRSFLASAAGILFSFLLLAASLIALQATGAAIGWGIQFQQPLFLIAMAVVVTLFAANLAGWCEIALPEWVGTRAGAGGDDHRLAGAFATGMLATLLATPCSAPFVGTAVGFALAGGAAEIVAIFAMMGLGLALPYLLVAAIPRIATALPRPGNWMVWLRRILALALASTALWLLTVVAGAAGRDIALIVAGLLAALLLVLWGRSRVGDTLRPLAAGLALLLVAATLGAAVWQGGVTRPRATVASSDALWQPFDRVAIDALVGEGRTVFVDVTADWCITCEVNKRLVLQRDPVASRLAGNGLVAMKADWTRPDDAIARYLADHGRYGIPFNAVYGPGAPEGIVLPELLDDDTVLDALDRAAGR